MKTYRLNIILFAAVLFLVSSMNYFLWSNEDTMELENRNLQTKPIFSIHNLLSGNYCRELENYFSDHFMYRSHVVELSSALKEWKGINNRNGASIVVHRGANVAESTASVEEALQKENSPILQKREGENRTNNNQKIMAGSDEDSISRNNKPVQKEEKDDASKLPSKVDKNTDAGNLVGGMLILNDKAMELYSFYREGCEYYANVINQFAEKVQPGTKVYSLLVPTQVEFINNARYKNIAVSQWDTIYFINQRLKHRIIPVNAYDVLSRNREKYIYFRTDHHWTALGAYYGYTGYCYAAGIQPVPVERYETGKVENYLGTTYAATLSKKLQKTPDTIYYYKPFTKHTYNVYYTGALKMDVIDLNHANRKNKYRIFLSGDRPLGKITTELENDKKIMIVKDSYGNAFIPFLLPHYKEIYIVDPRQFKQNILQFVKEKGIQEVLFLNYVPAANMKDFSDLIVDCMNRQENTR